MNEPFRFDFGSSGESREKGESMVPNQGVDSNPAAGAATTEAQEHIAQVRKKRGRPARDESAAIAEREKIREELSREFAQLFAPEYWEGIVRGPADLMLAISKRALWDIPDKEIKPLAIGASHTARLFLRTDPKWIALLMFSVSLTQVYGARFAIHMAQVRKEQREKQSRSPETAAPKPV